MNKYNIENKNSNIALEENLDISIQNSNVVLEVSKKVSKIVISSLIDSEVEFKISNDVEIVLFHNKTSSNTKVKFDVIDRNARVEIKSIAITSKKDKFKREVWIAHSAKDSYTDYKFFGFAFGKSALTINAVSKIHKGMHGSEAHQILRVLTEQEAIASAQPGLLVDDFDVVASHGNSIGQLDSRALYYLESRGIPRTKARWLIIKGKMKEVLQNMDQSIAEDVLRNVAESMGVSYE